jgi:hypothetical protein
MFGQTEVAPETGGSLVRLVAVASIEMKATVRPLDSE